MVTSVLVKILGSIVDVPLSKSWYCKDMKELESLIKSHYGNSAINFLSENLDDCDVEFVFPENS